MTDETTSPRPPRRTLTILIWLIVLGSSGYFTYHWFISSKPEAPGRGGRRGLIAPMAVSAATAVRENFEEWTQVAGTVTPLQSVVVRSRVDGELKALHFNEGSMVQQGDVIAEIDPRPFQVTLDQAKGQQARDQALLENARADLTRYETLLAQDSISKQQVDTQKSLVSQYEAALLSDQAAIDSAALQLSFTKIEAPISGRIGLRQVDVGNLVRSSDTNGLVSLVQIDPITLVFAIPQDVIGAIQREHQSGKEVPVEATASGSSRTLVKGKLLTIDNQIDPLTGTLRMRAQVPNPKGELIANQFVGVRVRLKVISDAILVPASAVQRGSQGAYVYVLNDDETVTMRLVKSGATHQERTQILEGLRDGERVVTEGIDRLRDGATVNLIDPQETKAASETGPKPKDGEHKPLGGERKRSGKTKPEGNPAQ